MAVSLELLTDEAILDYTRRGNKNHIITDHRDVELKTKPFAPYRGGLYDIDIFGSPYEDRCICGKIKTVSKDPCPNCGAIVYSKEESLRRFARIELPFYYLNDLRYDIFKEFIDQVFSDSIVTYNFSSLAAQSSYMLTGGRRLSIKAYDSCQFEYDIDKKELTISDIITDEEKCSYEGILKILEDHFPGEVSRYKEFINRYYIVMPSIMRPIAFSVIGGQKKISVPKLTSWYSVVVRLCGSKDKGENTLSYEKVINQFKTPGERVKYTALLRALINTGKRAATELLNSSKQNLARELYSVRTKNSLRCPIVPSTTLAIDEVGIPRHLAYEICRSGFIKYLMDTYNFSEDEAIRSTRYEAMNPEMQQRFDEYANNQVVIINRPPTLHEYNMIGLRMRLNDNYTIDLPIQLCAPLAGDRLRCLLF